MQNGVIFSAICLSIAVCCNRIKAHMDELGREGLEHKRGWDVQPKDRSEEKYRLTNL